MEKGEGLVHLNMQYTNRKGIDIEVKGRSVSPHKESVVTIMVMDDGLNAVFKYDTKEKRGWLEA